MKYFILSMFFLVGCKEDCEIRYDTSTDQAKCWKECAQSAAASNYFQYNFNLCLNTACNYKSVKSCE